MFGFLYLSGAIILMGVKTVLLRAGILHGGTNNARMSRSLAQTVTVLLIIYVALGTSGFAVPGTFEIIYHIINGCFGGLAFILFCKGLESIEVSTARPLLSFRMIIPVSLGIIILEEALTLEKALGIIFAFTAIILLTSESE